MVVPAVASIRVSLCGVQHAYTGFVRAIVEAVVLFVLGCAFMYCNLVEYTRRSNRAEHPFR